MTINKKQMSKNETKEDMLLINVANSFEAEIIISKLKTENIPSYIKHSSIGEYLNIATGISYQGVDVYVPVELQEKAKEIITPDENSIYEDSKTYDLELEELKGKYIRRKKAIRYFVIITMIIPFVLYIIDKVF